VFRVRGLGFKISGFRFRVEGLEFQVSGFGFRVSGFGFRVSGFEFRVSGPWMQVSSGNFGSTAVTFSGLIDSTYPGESIYHRRPFVGVSQVRSWSH